MDSFVMIYILLSASLICDCFMFQKLKYIFLDWLEGDIK